MDDGVSSDAEVEWAVKRLLNNRAGGASRMRADLKGWLAAARRGGKGEGHKYQGRRRQGGRTGVSDGGGGTLGEGRGDCTDGISGRRTGGGSHMAGGGPHTER